MIRNASKLLVATVLATLSVTTTAYAQNRDAEDSMFAEKTDSTLIEQAVIGVGEYLLFNALHVKEHGLTPFHDQLDASERIKLANSQEALKNPDLPLEEQLKLKTEIKKLEDSLIQRRITVAANYEKAALRAKGINSILYAGQALTVVDMFGRLYVWQKLDRDPGVSPVATFVLKKVGAQ